MTFRITKRFLGRLPVTRVLFILVLLAAAFPPAASPSAFPSPQADQDALFNQAVQDYTQNRLSEAKAKFERVSGTHAQVAQQYSAKIKAYTDAMTVASGVLRRTPDEIDDSSLTYAIRKYEEALKIKPDGPWNPAGELEKAKAMRTQIVQKGAASREARDRDFCTKAIGAQQEHHYREAALYSCPLANDNPGYNCGGNEAVQLCEQMTALAKYDKSPDSIEKRQPPEVLSGGHDADLDRAKAVYDRNDFERARVLFQRFSGDLKPAAEEYLDKISRYQDAMAQGSQLSRQAKYEEARAAYQNAASIKADGSGNPQNQALLMELLQGMDLFYSGDYPGATQHLEIYARDSSERQPLAHFYLGASKLARFFLSGSEDADLRQEALDDLKVAKQGGFKVTTQDVSPKILQAYDNLAF